MRPPSRWLVLASFVASVVALTAGTIPGAMAQDLVSPPVKDRHFPQGVYCPLPVDLAFVANGSTATIRFSTNVFYFNTSTSQIEWSHQFLDNLSIATQTVFNSHLAVPGTYSQECYVGDLIAQRFEFQNAGTLPFLDTFSSDPTG